jgi:hypothetical protein
MPQKYTPRIDPRWIRHDWRLWIRPDIARWIEVLAAKRRASKDGSGRRHVGPSFETPGARLLRMTSV